MRNDLSFLSLEIGGEKIEESLKKNRSTENEKKNKHYNNLHKPYTPRVFWSPVNLNQNHAPVWLICVILTLCNYSKYIRDIE